MTWTNWKMHPTEHHMYMVGTFDKYAYMIVRSRLWGFLWMRYKVYSRGLDDPTIAYAIGSYPDLATAQLAAKNNMNGKMFFL